MNKESVAGGGDRQNSIKKMTASWKGLVHVKPSGIC